MITKRDKEKQRERREELLDLTRNLETAGYATGGIAGGAHLMNLYLKSKGNTKTLHHNKVLGPAALAGLGVAGVSSYAHHKLKKRLKEEKEDVNKEK
jgi:hypothetical protein